MVNQPTPAQIKLLSRLRKRIGGLDLNGYFHPEETRSYTWPYWMMSWEFDHEGQTYAIYVECAWNADSYKLTRLHDVRVHGMTYDYDARFLDSRFLEAFKAEWDRALNLTST